jgi:tetratricopeptide (TPR) repeat protein
MPQQEAIELFDSALHYCTGQLNQGNRVFLQEYFDVFEDAINKEVFIIQGELAPWRLNNVVGVALRLGKLEWAEAFIEAHKQYLPTETRINTYTFNLARVYRYQKKYDKVLATLRNIEYEDIGYNLISKAMLTITYYELAEFDTLDSLLESFRVFLNRHKNIPQQTRKIYLNLIKYTRRMTRLGPTDKAGVTALMEEITLEKANIVNHEWLLEKLSILA